MAEGTGERLRLRAAGGVLEVHQAVAVVVDAVAADLARRGRRSGRASGAVDAAAVGSTDGRAARARATAEVRAVADLAALGVDHAVAALELTVRVAPVAVGRVAVVALLVAVDDAVADLLDRAVGGAAVAVRGIAVVTLLAGIEVAVAAAWRPLARRAGSRDEGCAAAAGEEGATGGRAGDVAVAHLARSHDAIAAHRCRGQGGRGRRRRRVRRDELHDVALEPHRRGGEAALERGARARTQDGRGRTDRGAERAFAGDAQERAGDEDVQLAGGDPRARQRPDVGGVARGQAAANVDGRRPAEGHLPVAGRAQVAEGIRPREQQRSRTAGAAFDHDLAIGAWRKRDRATVRHDDGRVRRIAGRKR